MRSGSASPPEPAGRLVRIAGRIARLDGWRRAAAAFAAGAVSVLALAPIFVSVVLFATLPILVWLIDGAASDRPKSWRNIRAAAGIGWWFGFGYHGFGLYWIGAAFLVQPDKFAWALPFAVTMLPAGLALFFALAAALAAMLSRSGLARVAALALTLTAVEWLRGHILTGLPWNTLGYALTFPLPLMQTAAVTGVYGLTPWVVAIFAGPLVAGADTALRLPRWFGPALAAIPLAAAFAYGTWRLALPVPPPIEGVRLRLVQPSVPQHEKWRPENQHAIFQDHLDLSLTRADGAQDGLDGITHVFWPEAAMPFHPLHTPEALDAIGRLLPEGVSLLAGALRREDGEDGRRRVFNSLMVFGSNGALTALYDKRHLVPFGEYLPFQGLLERFGFEQLTRLRGGFSSGTGPRPLLHVTGLPPLGALICYEAIFPGQVVPRSERPGVLINVTNDGWFGITSGPHQHLHQARVRAVEEGLPLVRAANNGISAAIDPYGRVLAHLPLDIRGTIDAALPRAAAPPPYVHLGDAVLLVEMGLLSAILVVLAGAAHRHVG